MFLLVAHVLKPLEDQEMVCPTDIPGEVPLVICRETGKVFPVIAALQ